MLEFIFEAIRPVNLPFTILLGLVAGYWMLVMLGALDFDSDPAIHVGNGGELHLDAADAGPADLVPVGGGGGMHGALKGMLQFLNFGDVPSMIVVSVMAASLWTFSMLGNHYLNDGSFWLALALLVPNLVLTAFITKAATTPLKKLFSALNREYEEHKPVVGRICTIITSEVTDSFGQAQIETSGAPLLINVRTYGAAAFNKGESALIIKEDKENNIFTVAKLTTTTEQQEQQQESHL